MKLFLLWLFCLVLLNSCTHRANANEENQPPKEAQSAQDFNTKTLKIPEGLVDIQAINSTILRSFQ
jgi:PBP1b-binding outer membrane lipoprotein LpoB